MTDPIATATATEPDAQAEPDRYVETTHDGWVYDLNTGEVIGRVEDDTYWTIDSPEGADRALELRAIIEADILALDARLKALSANLHALRRERERRLSWWEWKFHGPLIAFARTRINKRVRSARFVHGVVSFRKTQPTTTIIDDAAALEFVDTWAPEAVTIKRSVTKKAVELAIERARPTLGDEPLPWVVTAPAGESINIKTGIKGDTDQ